MHIAIDGTARTRLQAQVRLVVASSRRVVLLVIVLFVCVVCVRHGANVCA